MVNITLAVPEELKHKMDSFIEINWSAVAREAFLEKIKDLEFIKNFKSKSTFTERDAIDLGRELNKNLVKRRV
ncbi:hypothetical protein J4427_02890 [Candidatus Woesearchaeota archaeon]|nr:hypothetical protein [Candidatus Woesearchaeota archaeon]